MVANDELSCLEPCPFCGGKAVHEFDNGEPIIHFYHDDGCFLAGVETMHDCPSAEEAWNRRAERTCEFFYDKKMAEYACSACGERVSGSNPDDEYEVSPLAVLESFEYCPHCGARVIEEES